MSTRADRIADGTATRAERIAHDNATKAELIADIKENGVALWGTQRKPLHAMTKEELLDVLAEERVQNEHFGAYMKREAVDAFQLGQSQRETVDYMAGGGVIINAPEDARKAFIAGMEEAARLCLQRGWACSLAADALALTMGSDFPDMLGMKQRAVGADHEARDIFNRAGTSQKRRTEIEKEVRIEMQRQDVSRKHGLEVLKKE